MGVQSVMMFQWIVSGKHLPGNPTKKHCEALQLLINEEVDRENGKSSQSVVPQYVLYLWQHFVRTFDCLKLNLELFRDDREIHLFSYSEMGRMFQNEDGAELDIGKLIDILPNIQWVYVYGDHQSRGLQTLPSNLIPKSKLLEIINRLNARRAPCQSISIAEPAENVDEFIANHQYEFKELGWTLTKQECPEENEQSR